MFKAYAVFTDENFVEQKQYSTRVFYSEDAAIMYCESMEDDFPEETWEYEEVK